MLVAYTPYSQLDEQFHPLGILPETPHAMQIIQDEDAQLFLDSGYVVVTQEDYDALIAYLTPLNEVAIPLSENFKVDEYNQLGLKINTIWYQDKIDSVFSNMAKKIEYTYTNHNSLKQIDVYFYNSKGETRHEITRYYTDTINSRIITETEVV